MGDDNINTTIQIRVAALKESSTVGSLIYQMECELWPEQTNFSEKIEFEDAAHRLLQADTGMWAFAAWADGKKIVGALTLNEYTAIYAGGYFGEIADLYVIPGCRSTGIGNALIDAPIDFGIKRGWPFLATGGPSLPRWQRTVVFYNGIGFEEIGSRLELAL